MNPDLVLFIIMALLGILAGLALKRADLGNLIKILRTPVTRVSELVSEGAVAVEGRAGLSMALESPITHTPCVLWEIEVYELRRSGRNSRWISVLKTSSTEPVAVQDDTGSILADPQGANLILKNDQQKTGGLFSTLDAETLAVIGGLGVNTEKTFLGTNRSLKVDERRVVQGDPLFVFGDFQYRQGGRMITLQEGTPFIISDRGRQALALKLGTGVAGMALLFGVIGAMFAPLLMTMFK